MQQETTRKHALWKLEKRVSEILWGSAPGDGILPATDGTQKIKGIADGV